MFPLLELLASLEMQLIFGIASGVLSIFAFVPYILDTIARRTEPQRASWLIWAVLGSIAFVSQVFEGATSSLWFAGVQVASTIIILVLSIWVGTGKFLGKTDYMILVAASIGLLLWYFTDNAAYALAITISISLLGGMATIVKAYRDPESETLITWVVSLAASVCAILSVGVVDPTLLAYPVYLFTLYLGFIVAIISGRARDSASAMTATIPARISMRTLSFAVLFSGLRATANVVIVSVAFVFAFNWIGADSSAVDSPADVSLHRAITDAPMPEALISDTSVSDNSMPDTTVSVALITDTPASDAQIIVDAPDLAHGYLLLDADDPFAPLLVTTDAAELAQESSSTLPRIRLPLGERVLALATNGEWFKVRVSDGLEGYLHHSQVSVEALSSLSVKGARSVKGAS